MATANLSLIDEISKAGSEFDAELAAANDSRSLDDMRVRWFGRKGGRVPEFFSRLKEVPKEHKKDVGDALNKLRDRIEAELKAKTDSIADVEAKKKAARDTIDVTLPARMPR